MMIVRKSLFLVAIIVTTPIDAHVLEHCKLYEPAAMEAMEMLGEKGAIFMYHNEAGSSAETAHRAGTELMQSMGG